MGESHKKYLKRINKLAASEPGGPRLMDGTPAKKNAVQLAHEEMIRRRYQGERKKK